MCKAPVDSLTQWFCVLVIKPLLPQPGYGFKQTHFVQLYLLQLTLKACKSKRVHIRTLLGTHEEVIQVSSCSASTKCILDSTCKQYVTQFLEMDGLFHQCYEDFGLGEASTLKWLGSCCLPLPLPAGLCFNFIDVSCVVVNESKPAYFVSLSAWSRWLDAISCVRMDLTKARCEYIGQRIDWQLCCFYRLMICAQDTCELRLSI